MRRVETVESGIFRDLNSRGLTMTKGAEYTKYKQQKVMEERMNMLENKLDKLIDLISSEKDI